jgi:hypothetical protein
MIESKHSIGYCNQCECDVVFCAACGNNCCNGTYGEGPNGKWCPDCPNAYDVQDMYLKDKGSVKFASKRETPLPSVFEILKDNHR